MPNERQTYRKNAARSASRSSNQARTRSDAPSKGSSAKKTTPSIGERFDNVLESLLKGTGAKKAQASSGRSSRTGRAAGQAAPMNSFATRFFSSKVAMGIAALIVLLLVIGLWDNVANYGRAYANVFINGKSVAGMDADQIRSTLEEDMGNKLSAGTVRIYASDKAQSKESSSLAQQENAAQAEQVSVEEARAAVTSWRTNASGLRASVPYDNAIEQALAAGREDGPLGRLALFVTRVDIPCTIELDDKAVEELANAIDSSIGEERLDATVVVEDGMASAVKGQDGKLVDREWLKEQIVAALLSDEEEASFVAEVSDAPSRTTFEQAQQMSTSINQALNSGLSFSYHSQSWTADPYDIGEWTKVDVEKVDDGYDLKATLNSSKATADLAKHLDASISGDNVIVDFEVDGENITVRTSGSGVIPEVAPAVEKAEEALYGPSGAAWASGGASAGNIEVGESNAPEALSFEQALDLGVIGVVSEYTTEFSNTEGTENRNHNIRLAADLLNNSVAQSGGGTWSFNEHSGDTNLDPPFASAGSIENGEYVDSIGGGICQVATTVFNAVYEAGLDVVERHNHSLYIASYPTGRDAAVSYPEMDLIWSNGHTSDILLTLDYTDTTLTAKLYSTPIGLKASTEEGEWEEGEKYSTQYETDDTLPQGSYYLKTTGSDGSQITIVRTVTDVNGTVVKQDEFGSVYAPKNEVYAIGPGTDIGEIASESQDEDESESLDEEEEDAWDSETADESSEEDGSYDEQLDEEYAEYSEE